MERGSREDGRLAPAHVIVRPHLHHRSHSATPHRIERVATKLHVPVALRMAHKLRRQKRHTTGKRYISFSLAAIMLASTHVRMYMQLCAPGVRAPSISFHKRNYWPETAHKPSVVPLGTHPQHPASAARCPGRRPVHRPALHSRASSSLTAACGLPLGLLDRFPTRPSIICRLTSSLTPTLPRSLHVPILCFTRLLHSCVLSLFAALSVLQLCIHMSRV